MAKPGVEQIKEDSQYLRGTLPQQLASDADCFDDPGKQLLKFHGIYQQDNRDARKERKKEGGGKLYFFMVRSKLPGGKLTAEQYLVHDQAADRHGNGTIRLTSRQGIQIHGVFKDNLKAHMRALNEALVSTLAACGDVERNVMSCPAPLRHDLIRTANQELADRIAQHLCPKTTSYHEVWLNGEKVPTEPKSDVVEPIYGKTYLPRKFKTGIAIPEDNCIDLLSNDLGFLAIHSGGKIEGYDVYVGGGMGMTHGMEKTYPRLASPLCFVTPDQVIDITTAIVKVQRDHGNREDRKLARMKYLIDNWGEARFRKTVEEYYGKPTADVKGPPVFGYEDHLGWHPQGDGKWWLGIHVVAGRIQDDEAVQMRTCLREIAKRYNLPMRVTPQQNLLLCDIAEYDKPAINKLLADHHVAHVETLLNVVRSAMACPALPTCGLALSDAERVLPDITEQIHAELARIGLSDEDVVIHMTGCPNGCARPYNSDIGIVGRQPGKYTLFAGGNHLGSALSFQYRDLVPHAEVGGTFRGPLAAFKNHRRPGERFGDFCRRLGLEELDRLSAAVMASAP